MGTAERFAEKLPDRLIAHLKLLQGDYGGFPVDRLQTATRAFQAGRDDEYVACALLHDIGDTLGPHNHADIAAAIVQPFVSEETHWIVEAPRDLPGLLFLPPPRARSGSARRIPRTSLFREDGRILPGV